jgi:hypothetical protein
MTALPSPAPAAAADAVNAPAPELLDGSADVHRMADKQGIAPQAPPPSASVRRLRVSVGCASNSGAERYVGGGRHASQAPGGSSARHHVPIAPPAVAARPRSASAGATGSPNQAHATTKTSTRSSATTTSAFDSCARSPATNSKCTEQGLSQGAPMTDSGVAHADPSAEYFFEEGCHITEWWNSAGLDRTCTRRARHDQALAPTGEYQRALRDPVGLRMRGSRNPTGRDRGPGRGGAHTGGRRAAYRQCR